MAETEPGNIYEDDEPPQRLTGLARMLRYRLVIPIARGRHDGVPTARGTAIGLAFGLTPTVGIQMPMIILFWAAMRWLKPAWRFNLIVALAWTWPTNVLTAPLYYYLCLITGRLMTGHGVALEFDTFRSQMESLLSQDAGWIESFWVYTVGIFDVWGVPLFIGCIPWAILGTWLGYVLTLKFIRKFQLRQRRLAVKRRIRRARKRAAQARSRETQI